MNLSSLKQVVCERLGNSLYFAVPDIHGRSDIARKVVSVLESLNAENVVFLGDLIDRQPDPLGVVRAVYQAKLRNPSWQLLRGNHEQSALDAFEGGVALDEENSIFKICTPSEISECCRIFYGLPIYHEAEYLLFVHGGIGNSYSLEIGEVPQEELLWSYGVHSAYSGKSIVRGHEVYEKPTEYHNNIATQTLAWAGKDIPFCVSLIRDTPDVKKLIGWIEIHLDGSNQIDFVINDALLL